MLIIVGNAEARKMLENGAESHQSSARGVGQPLWTQDSITIKKHHHKLDKILHSIKLLTDANISVTKM